VRHVVLSGVRNRTHLVYASSYLRHVLAHHRGPVELTVLPTGTLLAEGPLGTPAVRGLLPGDERLTVRLSDTADVRAAPVDTELLCIGAPTVRAWSAFTLAHRGRRPRVVVVDEGIGSYGTWRTRRAAYRREAGREPRSTVRALVVATGARILPDLRWSLYRQGPSGWAVDERIAAEFRLRLSGRPAPPGRAVYLTQPWTALGLLDLAQYRAHLDVVGRATEAAGLALVVKPHPWEPAEVYRGLTVLEGGPAELERPVVEAELVIGANSTALLNLAAVHGTPVARVVVPQLAELDAALGPRQRSLLDAFLPPAATADRLTLAPEVGPTGES
jgi:hypothetical protein